MELPQLQSLIGKDAAAYRDDFLLQYRHFQTERAIFVLNPSQQSKRFTNLVNFLTAVAQHYVGDVTDLPREIITLLDQHASVLDPELRQCLVKSLMIMSSKKIVTSHVLLPLCFKLFRVHDKELRTLVYQHIVQDVKRANKGHKNVGLNKTLQNFMFTMLQDESEIAQKKSLDVMIDLYRRGIWRDAKTVNVMAQACLSSGKVVAPALRFFIDPTAVNPEDDEEADQRKKKKVPLHKQFSAHSKQRKSKKRKLEEALKEEGKEQRREKERQLEGEATYPAIDMLYDPQGFVEKLFAKLKKSAEAFDVRVLMIRLISRCIKRHKLQLDAFYPFLQKYMQPHQEYITLILVSVVESSHELVAPETLEPIIKTLLKEFITDYRPGPLIQLGINTLREMAMRCPLCLDAETLKQVTQFKGFTKDKGVVMAARGLINLYRAINPAILDRKDRGKDGQMNLASRKPKAFGEVTVFKTIPGMEREDDDVMDEDDGDSDSDNDNEDVGSGSMESGSEEGVAVGDDNDDDDDENVDDAGSGVEAGGDESGSEEAGSDDDDDDDDDNDDNDDEDDDDEAPELVPADEGDGRKSGKKVRFNDGGDDDDEDGENGDEMGDNDDEQEDDEEEEEDELPAPEEAAVRTLTNAEFEAIERARKRKEGDRASLYGDDTTFVGVDPDRDVSVADLNAWKPRKKSTKEERVAAVEAGREDREGYWDKKKAEKESGTNNKEKLKSKPFLMIKNSKRIRDKLNLSMKEKQQLQKKRAMRRKGKRFIKGSGIMSGKKR